MNIYEPMPKAHIKFFKEKRYISVKPKKAQNTEGHTLTYRNGTIIPGAVNVPYAVCMAKKNFLIAQGSHLKHLFHIKPV